MCPSTFPYQRNEYSVGGNATVSPPVNEVSTMIAMGETRNEKTRPHQMRSRTPPSSRYRRRIRLSSHRLDPERPRIPEQQPGDQDHEHDRLGRTRRPVEQHGHLLLDEDGHH